MSPAVPTEQVPTSTYAYRVPGVDPPESEPQPPPRRRWLGWVVLLVLLAVAGAIAWRTVTAKREATATAARKQQAMANLAVPVQTVEVQQQTVPIYLTGLGSVTPYYSVKVIPRVTGELLRINFKEGQEVRKGQELMTIDPRPYQATLDQAKGQLARDQAQLANNQAEYNRYKALFDQGVVSREQLGTYESNLGQFQGAIKADEATIEAAQLNVTYCHVTSPIDGRVGLRQVDPGNLVSANTTITLLINQFRPIAVFFTLPEDQLQRVLGKLRQARQLDALAFDRSDSHQLESGKLLTADNQIDATTGTDKLKAVFANADEQLFPNQFVNVHLVLEQRPHAITIPAAALQHGTDGDFVWLVKPESSAPDSAASGRPGAGGTDSRNARPNGAEAQPRPSNNRPGNSGTSNSGPSNSGSRMVASMQPVKVDTVEGATVVLAEGLTANDQVVVDGADKLQDGTRVIPSSARSNRKTPQQQTGPA